MWNTAGQYIETDILCDFLLSWDQVKVVNFNKYSVFFYSFYH
jgi:hypothetical protein